ncbi:MAG: 16S rRNA processing protein RimM [Nitrospirae bacterium]|nr:16S rRNA processing protein RimM [Nitrospirota bacterium]
MRTGDTGIAPGTDSDFVAVAFIARIHGLRGDVKVVQLSDDPDRIYSLNKVYIVSKNGETKESCIKNIKAIKGGFVVSLSTVLSASDAQHIVGSYISVPQDEVPEPGKDRWYHYEIIGIEVFTTGGVRLGKVEEIITTGSNDVYIVRNNDREYLIPAIRDVIKDVDTKKRRMVIAVMDGLIEM